MFGGIEKANMHKLSGLKGNSASGAVGLGATMRHKAH